MFGVFCMLIIIVICIYVIYLSLRICLRLPAALIERYKERFMNVTHWKTICLEVHILHCFTLWILRIYLKFMSDCSFSFDFDGSMRKGIFYIGEARLYEALIRSPADIRRFHMAIEAMKSIRFKFCKSETYSCEFMGLPLRIRTITVVWLSLYPSRTVTSAAAIISAFKVCRKAFERRCILIHPHVTFFYNPGACPLAPIANYVMWKMTKKRQTFTKWHLPQTLVVLF